MASLRSVVLVAMFASVSSELYKAEVGMDNIQGTVEFNTISRQIKFNLLLDCAPVYISLHEFPVMYGHFKDPCNQSNIGKKIYEFNLESPNVTLNERKLFQFKSDFSDLTVVVHGCLNESKACATVRSDMSTETCQGKFFSTVAGDVYIRHNPGAKTARVLADLMTTNSSHTPVNVSLYLQAGEASCASVAPNETLLVGTFKVGTPLNQVKSRVDDWSPFVPLSKGSLLYMYDGARWSCTKMEMMKEKQVWAYVNMKGVKGSFSFRQASPFDATYYTMSLMNLRGLAATYHVHNFPVPQRSTPTDQLCSNDNVGGHLNPFGKILSGPSYPRSTNETHDQYEVGDLSGRHGDLKGLDMVKRNFIDWNLPLFGRNSIIGHSIVIHHPNNSRWVCGTIGYPGEVLTAAAIFKSPVSGRVIFRQLKSNPYSDLSVFMELSYTNSSAQKTDNHLWYINNYPISSELDLAADACLSTKGHFNPFKVDVGNNYNVECSPNSPFRCEVGDFAKKHQTIMLSNQMKVVDSKHFFTDATSSLAGPLNIVARSVVILGQDFSSSPLACANITFIHPASVEIHSWKGIGKVGKVTFKQLLDLDSTVVEVNLTDLNSKAETYNIHTLPIKAVSSNADVCSPTNIGGRYNPFNVNGSLSPKPGNGTVDQYEVGDISGKFGQLSGLNQTNEEYMDKNMPLFGPHSISNRSLVIYQEDGSPLRCANLLEVKATDGEFIYATVKFGGAVNGTITLSQQVFPDGSYSDTTMNIDLELSDPNAGDVNLLMWHIHTYPAQFQNCSGLGGHYNPYNIDIKANYGLSCSLATPLHCEIGDLNSKQGPISLGKRYLKTDVNLPLTGDFTVVGRSVVIHNADHHKSLKDCANIVADYNVKTVMFPNVDPFSRYEFRKTVAESLGIMIWRVTILPGSPSLVPAKECQQVIFYVAGNVDEQKIANLEKDDNMGKFKATKKCTTDSSGSALSLFLNARQFVFWILSLILQFILYSVFE